MFATRKEAMPHRLVSYELEDGLSATFLAPGASAPFIAKLAGNPKTRQRAVAITRAVTQVARNGVGWAKESCKFRSLDAGLALYELKANGKVIRVMTYVHRESVPIYLFDFDGHQGKSGSIPKHVMERGRSLAEQAARLMEEEHDD